VKKKNITEMPLPPDSNCAACMSEARAAVSAMRDLGASTTQIASAAQLSVEVVEQHFARCVPPIICGEESDEELAQLLRDSTELYYAAVIGSAWPAASSALAVRLRALTELARRTEIRAQQGGLLDGSDPLRPETWGPQLSAFINTYIEDIIRRAATA